MQQIFLAYMLLYYCSIVLMLFVMSWLSVKKFISIASQFNIIDLPNNRSSHTIPVVRGGGIVISLLSELVIIGLYFLEYLNIRVMLALSCAFIVSIIGFIDDLIILPVKPRLLVQFVASLIAVALIVPLNIHSIISISIFIILMVGLVWSTNLFNFMDGTDGFAASEAIFVLTTASLLLFLNNNIEFGCCLLLISIIIFGFLCFNFPPAKIFMGDAGSCFLGFLIGISAIISHFIFGVSLFFWFIIYAVFVFDATITLLRRFISGQQWYASHRSHAYQRLQNIGWQHSDILCGLILLNTCLIFIIFIAYYYNILLSASVLVLALLSILYFFIELRENKNEKNI